MTVFNFNWKEKEATFNLKWQIIKEKLSQGINGVEWLVLNHAISEIKTVGLSEWVEYLAMYGHINTEIVMLDALTMDSDTFYEEYEFNWWMSISYTLEHLCLLRIRNYDEYFDLINKIDKYEKGE